MHSVGVDLTMCQWMAIVAVALVPLTWMGSPKDFWSLKALNPAKPNILSSYQRYHYLTKDTHVLSKISISY